MEKSDAARRLAERLRTLRQQTWPGVRLTQPQVASALGVSPPLISSWENRSEPTVPPEERLAGYARLFATSRSIEGNQVRLIFDLTEGEDRARADLEGELRGLRAVALGEVAPVSDAPPTSGVNRPPSAGLWRFADGAPVTIVCGELPPALRADKAYTNQDSPDYVELYTFADLDALMELYGHVCAANPDSRVQFLLPSFVTQDHLTTHLVLLGGVDWNELIDDVISALAVPVTQAERESEDEEGAFVVGDGDDTKTFRPVLRGVGTGRVLVEDVAHFCRGANPFNKLRTVTICGGQYGRGTYGAVRALTDPRFRDRNAWYVRSRFAQEQAFSILTRVRVVRGEVVTPDWTEPGTTLFEWPAKR